MTLVGNLSVPFAKGLGYDMTLCDPTCKCDQEIAKSRLGNLADGVRSRLPATVKLFLWRFSPALAFLGLVFWPLLRDLLDHLSRAGQAGRASASRTDAVHKQTAGRALQHLLWHRYTLAILGADPSDEDGVGSPRLAITQEILSENLTTLAVGLAGLLLEELVDCFLLLTGIVSVDLAAILREAGASVQHTLTSSLRFSLRLRRLRAISARRMAFSSTVKTFFA